MVSHIYVLPNKLTLLFQRSVFFFPLFSSTFVWMSLLFPTKHNVSLGSDFGWENNMEYFQLSSMGLCELVISCCVSIWSSRYLSIIRWGIPLGILLKWQAALFAVNLCALLCSRFGFVRCLDLCKTYRVICGEPVHHE